MGPSAPLFLVKIFLLGLLLYLIIPHSHRCVYRVYNIHRRQQGERSNMTAKWKAYKKREKYK